MGGNSDKDRNRYLLRTGKQTTRIYVKSGKYRKSGAPDAGSGTASVSLSCDKDKADLLLDDISGTLRENGQRISVERKLEIARQLEELLGDDLGAAIGLTAGEKDIFVIGDSLSAILDSGGEVLETDTGTVLSYDSDRILGELGGWHLHYGDLSNPEKKEKFYAIFDYQGGGYQRANSLLRGRFRAFDNTKRDQEKTLEEGTKLITRLDGVFREMESLPGREETLTLFRGSSAAHRFDAGSSRTEHSYTSTSSNPARATGFGEHIDIISYPPEYGALPLDHYEHEYLLDRGIVLQCERTLLRGTPEFEAYLEELVSRSPGDSQLKANLDKTESFSFLEPISQNRRPLAELLPRVE